MPTEKSHKSKRFFRKVFRLNGFRQGFKFAYRGISYLFLYHRNMRVIFMIGIAAFLTGFFFKLRGIELAILCATITLVFMAEIFNTAIEMLMDMLNPCYNIRLKLIKDIAAAVVLLTSLNAVAVGYILFIRKIFR